MGAALPAAKAPCRGVDVTVADSWREAERDADVARPPLVPLLLAAPEDGDAAEKEMAATDSAGGTADPRVDLLRSLFPPLFPRRPPPPPPPTPPLPIPPRAVVLRLLSLGLTLAEEPATAAWACGVAGAVVEPW